MLETYCNMFELDWRGDRTFENKKEFMSFNPVYIEGENVKDFLDLNEADISQMIKKACASYVTEAANKLLNTKR